MILISEFNISMEDKQIINLYITGFGPFDTITHNPTTEIVNDTDLCCLNEMDKFSVNIEFKEVLDVGIESVNDAINKIHDLIQEHIYDNSKNLIIHLGTDYSSSKIWLEKQAINWMNFTIPDNEGNQPENEKIDKKLKIDHCLLSRVNTSDISAKLRECKHNWVESDDAGDYICNYSFKLKNNQNSHIFITKAWKNLITFKM